MVLRNVRYVPNHSDMRKHMLGPDTAKAAADAAGDVADAARAIAPRSSDDGKVHYADLFEVAPIVVTIQDGGYTNPRAASMVVNTADYAAALEFGDRALEGGDQRSQGGSAGRPQRILRRAGEAVGEYKGGLG